MLANLSNSGILQYYAFFTTEMVDEETWTVFRYLWIVRFFPNSILPISSLATSSSFTTYQNLGYHSPTGSGQLELLMCGFYIKNKPFHTNNQPLIER